jgi:hypothetical protein
MAEHRSSSFRPFVGPPAHGEANAITSVRQSQHQRGPGDDAIVPYQPEERPRQEIRRERLRKYFVSNTPIDQQLERGDTLHNRCRTRYGQRKVVRPEATVAMGHGHELPATLVRGVSRYYDIDDDDDDSSSLYDLHAQRHDTRRRAPAGASEDVGDSSATLVERPKPRAVPSRGPAMAPSRTLTMEEGTGVQMAPTMTRFTAAMSRMGRFMSGFGREQPVVALQPPQNRDELSNDLAKDDEQKTQGPQLVRDKSKLKSRRQRNDGITEHVARQYSDRISKVSPF